MTDALRENVHLWDLATCRDEYAPSFIDQYGRPRQFVSGGRDALDPVVSRFLADRGLVPSWPGDAPFAVALSHDIDILRVFPYEIGLALLDRRFRAAGRLALGRLMRRFNEHWNLRRIMDIEAAYGARSTFNVLALEPGERDFTYRVDDVRDDLREIVRRGWEIGLHGGHDAYRDPVALRREKARLERILGAPVVGYRSHYLRFAVPETWALLAAAGFAYDATFGYADCVGFRNGMCHPFRPFDRRAAAPIDIVEIPLAVMDRTLEGYHRLSAEKAWEVVARLIDVVAECRGVLGVLWHNTTFAEEYGALYERLLAACRARGAWMTSYGEVCRWWQSQGV